MKVILVLLAIGMICLPFVTSMDVGEKIGPFGLVAWWASALFLALFAVVKLIRWLAR